jgi:hypothetical protein
MFFGDSGVTYVCAFVGFCGFFLGCACPGDTIATHTLLLPLMLALMVLVVLLPLVVAVAAAVGADEVA